MDILVPCGKFPIYYDDSTTSTTRLVDGCRHICLSTLYEHVCVMRDDECLYKIETKEIWWKNQRDQSIRTVDKSKDGPPGFIDLRGFF